MKAKNFTFTIHNLKKINFTENLQLKILTMN